MKASSLGSKLGKRLANHGGEIGASLLAVAWFLHLGFGPTLDPTFVAWLLRDDWSAFHWGFSFFRNAPWSFPVGAVPDLFYPYGTSVAFTDANPWLATLCGLVSGVLPKDFQAFGPWLLLCYVLQAVFGARLVATFTEDPVIRALGGAMFALTPVLAARNPHLALCGVFFLTAALSQSLSRPTDARDAKRRVAISFALLAWAAGTHGYLSVMLLVLSFANYAQLWLTDKLFTPRQFAAAVAGALTVTLSVYYLFGYLGWRELELGVEGFGDFSADLLTLVNSMGWSRIAPTFPVRPRQHEGFAYLGLGVLVLLPLGIVIVLRRWHAVRPAIARLWPTLLVVAAMAFYSLSSRVTLAGENLYDLRPLYEPLRYLTDIFRSSGRFIWPLHLLLIAAAVSVTSAIRSPIFGRALLLVALTLQAVEFDPAKINVRAVDVRPLHGPVWDSLGRDYRHIQLVPIHVLWVCRYDRKLVDRLSWRAYLNGMTINSGNVMRRPPGIKDLCEDHLPEQAPLDAHTMYVVDRKYVNDFRDKNAICGTLDQHLVCVDGQRETLLTKTLRRSPVVP